MQEDRPSATSTPVDQDPEAGEPRDTTQLAEMLVEAVRASGQSVSACLRDRHINRTWFYKITKDGHIPREANVVFLADAFDIDRAELLRAAGYPPQLPTQAPKTQSRPSRNPLGTILHNAQVNSAESVNKYCNNRKISRTTWVRAVDRGEIPREATIVSLATKTGLDRQTLLDAGGY